MKLSANKYDFNEFDNTIFVIFSSLHVQLLCQFLFHIKSKVLVSALLKYGYYSFIIQFELQRSQLNFSIKLMALRMSMCARKKELPSDVLL